MRRTLKEGTINGIPDRRQPSQPFPLSLGGIFTVALDAVVIMDLDGVVRDWNPAAEATFGYAREEALGSEVAELIVPAALRDAHRNGLRRYLQTGGSSILDRRIELTGLRADGSEFPVELTVTRVPELDPPGFAGFVRDLSERDLARRENSRLQERMAFLAQVGLVLDRSLDYNETLRTLADLTIPELAQLTVIDLLDAGGAVETCVAASVQPASAPAVEAMRRAHPLDLTSGHPVVRVLRAMRPVLLPSMTTDFLQRIAQGSEHFELMRRLRYHSAIVVPLVARRHALGTLSLLRMDDAPSYNQDDLVLAEELARRAALAIDNARLFESTRHIARTLQDSLLPRELPRIPGVTITGSYRAGAREQEVGGDFYDAFAIGENRWGIAIGDVCGKGPEAAALTALARYTIRALADRDPESVLERLNDAVIRDQHVLPERFLTAVVAVASLEDDRLELAVVAAGHPPPLILRADGGVDDVPAGGLMIGVSGGVRYAPERAVLRPGDRMLLYTDGLTDARAPERILSQSDVEELLISNRHLHGERLASMIVETATGGADPRDDIALLIIEVVG
jgi:PAS domain S-box-containing protein